MSARIISVIVAMALAGVAKAEVAVIVELVPDNPGPYVGGESLTVDVWLHSQVSFDVTVDLAQFDFTNTDTRLGLDPRFSFDYSSIPAGTPVGYLDPSLCPKFCPSPDLMVPWTFFVLSCLCTEGRIPLAAGETLHIGSIGVRLPASNGLYRLDLLNAAEPDFLFGGIGSRINNWLAFNGEITGGAFVFVLGNAIPTVSQWGLIVMVCLVAMLGSVIIMRRQRMSFIGESP